MRVLVCGGRDYQNERVAFLVLDFVNDTWGIRHVIEGGALGADRFARRWAAQNNVTVSTFEADWSLGRRAGPIRNQRMLEEGRPMLVVAFPGGNGTADMVRRARANRVPVLEIPALSTVTSCQIKSPLP